jgi:phosphoserine phosphatase RsbU/P
VLCLITDGVVEATGRSGELFGEDRLTALLGAPGPTTASQLLATVFEQVEAFTAVQTDDVTSVILRRQHANE